MTGQNKMDQLLLHYAAGTLNRTESFLVAAFLALNPQAHRKVIEFERLGGTLIHEEAPAPLSAACLENVLKKIENAICVSASPAIARISPKAVMPPGPVIPEKLSDLFHDYCAEELLHWSLMTRGIRKMEMPRDRADRSGNRLRLMHLEPYHSTPSHAHRGIEITLILDGGYSDSNGTYKAGDIVVIEDPGFVHSPKAGPEGCLCLSLTKDCLQFQTPFNRFLNLFLKL